MLKEETQLEQEWVSEHLSLRASPVPIVHNAICISGEIHNLLLSSTVSVMLPFCSSCYRWRVYLRATL